jgi:hypothetical protein
MLTEGISSASNFIPLMFKDFLPAELRIVEVIGRTVQSKAARVRIDKINVKGLRFSSELLFPVSPQIIFNFHVVILNEGLDLKGTIKWTYSDNNLNIYEVELHKDEPIKLFAPIKNLMRQYMPLHLRAEYYNKYFLESASDFYQNRINFLL